jgi:tRNA dimethylallyltransferase
MKKVIMIAGPTAVGKTELSIRLAKRINGEIISADSVQIYKSLTIGSAKPTLSEQCGVPHHMLDFLEPSASFSVSDYAHMARKTIEDILSRGKTPIVVGGTGLYFNALLYDMDFGSAPEDVDYRRHLEHVSNDKGSDYLYQILIEKDPDAANKIHPNNIRRVIRALEVIHITGKTMGDFAKDPVPVSEYDPILFGLTRSRMKLYGRINKRVDLMLEAGLIDEVKNLKKDGIDDSCQSMQGIGYKEVLEYLDDKYDFDTMKSILKQSSRRYAKRQMTWFRRYKEIQWLDLDAYASLDDIIDRILSTL